jgi:acyl-CoA thioesterase-2
VHVSDERAAAFPQVVPEAAPGLAALLDLARIDDDVFRAPPRGRTPARIFGGAVAAQALLAAGRTVPGERAAHSLHAYFLRPGDASLPIDLRVDRIRDGGSFTTRQVTAEQDGAATLVLSASFQGPEDGFEHQVPRLDASPPEDLPGPAEAMAGTEGVAQEWLGRLAGRHPFDFRFDGELPRFAAARGEPAAPLQRFWFRYREPLPDDPLVHTSALAYASDMLLLSTSVAPHGIAIGSPDLVSASLDHAVWFHRPVRADDWLFYDQESSRAAGGRSHCSGRMFDREGRLVASVAQEGMIRRRAAAPPSP